MMMRRILFLSDSSRKSRINGFGMGLAGGVKGRHAVSATDEHLA